MKLTLTLCCDGFQRDCDTTTSVPVQAHDSLPHAAQHLHQHAIDQGWDIRPVTVDAGVLGQHEETRHTCPDCAHRLHTWAAEQILHSGSRDSGHVTYQPMRDAGVIPEGGA